MSKWKLPKNLNWHKGQGYLLAQWESRQSKRLLATSTTSRAPASGQRRPCGLQSERTEGTWLFPKMAEPLNQANPKAHTSGLPAIEPITPLPFKSVWGEKARVGCSEKTALKQVYYQRWNRSPAQAGCMRQVLRAGALGRPRGMGWGGWWEGVSGWGTDVNPWLIHVNVWQKPLQYCN